MGSRTRRLRNGGMVGWYLEASDRIPSLALQENDERSFQCWCSRSSQRKGHRPPRKCPAAVTAESLAPSWKDAASFQRVEEREAVGVRCSATVVVSSYRAQDRVARRNPSECAPVEGWKGIAMRRNASTADRMVILVIALIVG